MGTSFEDVRLRRTRVGVEATFGTDGTSGAVTFVDAPVIEGTEQAQRVQAHHDPQTVQQYLFARESEVLGPKSATYKCSTLLASHGLSIDGTVANASLPVPSGTGTQWWMANLLASACMGGWRVENTVLGAQTKVVASPAPTTTSFSVTASHGTRFTAGAPVLMLNPTTAKYEANVVKTVSTDALTFKFAFSFTPATADVVYSGATAYMKENPTTSIQMWTEGQHDYDKQAYLGMNGTPSFDLKIGQLTKVGFDFIGATWAIETNSSLAAASVSMFSPVEFKDSYCIVTTVGSTTRTSVPISGITIAPGFKYEKITTPAGVETVYRNMLTRTSPGCTATLETYYEQSLNPVWQTLHDSRTQVALFQQLGSSAPGSVVLIELPTVQAQNPQNKAQGSFAGRTIAFNCRNDQELGTTSELTRSMLKVHFL